MSVTIETIEAQVVIFQESPGHVSAFVPAVPSVHGSGASMDLVRDDVRAKLRAIVKGSTSGTVMKEVGKAAKGEWIKWLAAGF